MLVIPALGRGGWEVEQEGRGLKASLGYMTPSPLLTKSPKLETREMPQSVKCFAFQMWGLGLDSRHPHGSIIIPELGRQR